MIVGGLLLVGLIAFFAVYQAANQDWSLKYEEEGKAPYDLKIMRAILDEQYTLQPTTDRVTKTLSREADKAQGTTYVYVGNEPKYTEDEAWHLRQYVSAGGEAFIITNEIPDSLGQFLFYAEDCGSFTDWMGRNLGVEGGQVYAGFTHPSISGELYSFEPSEFDYNVNWNYWRYIPEQVFCNEGDRTYPIAKLGEFTDNREDSKQANYTNFVRLKVGEGYFYFHTNPIMFTNYYLDGDSLAANYARNVFAHASNNQLIWDRESVNLPKVEGKKRARPSGPPPKPLQYIFSRTALRWSWYLLLGLSLTYILFRGKRRQRRVPIRSSNRNTSLEFVETIGTLYFQQQDHKGIINKQMHLFLGHIRQRYHLVTRDLDEKLIDRIVVRARVDRTIVQDIFNQYFKLKPVLDSPNRKVAVEVLNNFYLLIERFHKAEEENKFEKTN